jgi:hypothetical protein
MHRRWGIVTAVVARSRNTTMTEHTVTNGPQNVRLVHRPTSVAGTTFVGWGPRLGSI